MYRKKLSTQHTLLAIRQPPVTSHSVSVCSAISGEASELQHSYKVSCTPAYLWMNTGQEVKEVPTALCATAACMIARLMGIPLLAVRT